MKNKFIKALLALAILGLSACVAIPKHDQILGSFSAPVGSCEKVGITTSFYDTLDSAFFIDEQIDPKERWRGSRNPSQFILEQLEASSLFELSVSPSVHQKYFIEFRRVVRDYNSRLQKISLWISTFTLGVFPGWGDGDYYLTATIFDTEGKKVAEYKSTIIQYDFYHGLVFLPFNYHEHTMAYINEKYLSQLTSEIIGKMIQDKLIKCTGF